MAGTVVARLAWMTVVVTLVHTAPHSLPRAVWNRTFVTGQKDVPSSFWQDPLAPQPVNSPGGTEKVIKIVNVQVFTSLPVTSPPATDVPPASDDTDSEMVTITSLVTSAPSVHVSVPAFHTDSTPVKITTPSSTTTRPSPPPPSSSDSTISSTADSSDLTFPDTTPPVSPSGETHSLPSSTPQTTGITPDTKPSTPVLILPAASSSSATNSSSASVISLPLPKLSSVTESLLNSSSAIPIRVQLPNSSFASSISISMSTSSSASSVPIQTPNSSSASVVSVPSSNSSTFSDLHLNSASPSSIRIPLTNSSSVSVSISESSSGSYIPIQLPQLSSISASIPDLSTPSPTSNQHTSSPLCITCDNTDSPHSTDADIQTKPPLGDSVVNIDNSPNTAVPEVTNHSTDDASHTTEHPDQKLSDVSTLPQNIENHADMSHGHILRRARNHVLTTLSPPPLGNTFLTDPVSDDTAFSGTTVFSIPTFVTTIQDTTTSSETAFPSSPTSDTAPSTTIFHSPSPSDATSLGTPSSTSTTLLPLSHRSHPSNVHPVNTTFPDTNSSNSFTEFPTATTVPVSNLFVSNQVTSNDSISLDSNATGATTEFNAASTDITTHNAIPQTATDSSSGLRNIQLTTAVTHIISQTQPSPTTDSFQASHPNDASAANILKSESLAETTFSDSFDPSTSSPHSDKSPTVTTEDHTTPSSEPSRFTTVSTEDHTTPSSEPSRFTTVSDDDSFASLTSTVTPQRPSTFFPPATSLDASPQSHSLETGNTIDKSNVEVSSVPPFPPSPPPPSDLEPNSGISAIVTEDEHVWTKQNLSILTTPRTRLSSERNRATLGIRGPEWELRRRKKSHDPDDFAEEFDSVSSVEGLHPKASEDDDTFRGLSDFVPTTSSVDSDSKVDRDTGSSLDSRDRKIYTERQLPHVPKGGKLVASFKHDVNHDFSTPLTVKSSSEDGEAPLAETVAPSNQGIPGTLSIAGDIEELPHRPQSEAVHFGGIGTGTVEESRTTGILRGVDVPRKDIIDSSAIKDDTGNVESGALEERIEQSPHIHVTQNQDRTIAKSGETPSHFDLSESVPKDKRVNLATKDTSRATPRFITLSTDVQGSQVTRKPAVGGTVAGPEAATTSSLNVGESIQGLETTDTKLTPQSGLNGNDFTSSVETEQLPPHTSSNQLKPKEEELLPARTSSQVSSSVYSLEKTTKPDSAETRPLRVVFQDAPPESGAPAPNDSTKVVGEDFRKTVNPEEQNSDKESNVGQHSDAEINASGVSQSHHFVDNERSSNSGTHPKVDTIQDTKDKLAEGDTSLHQDHDYQDAQPQYYEYIYYYEDDDDYDENKESDLKPDVTDKTSSTNTPSTEDAAMNRHGTTTLVRSTPIEHSTKFEEGETEVTKPFSSQSTTEATLAVGSVRDHRQTSLEGEDNAKSSTAETDGDTLQTEGQTTIVPVTERITDHDVDNFGSTTVNYHSVEDTETTGQTAGQDGENIGSTVVDFRSLHETRSGHSADQAANQDSVNIGSTIADYSTLHDTRSTPITDRVTHQDIDNTASTAIDYDSPQDSLDVQNEEKSQNYDYVNNEENIKESTSNTTTTTTEIPPEGKQVVTSRGSEEPIYRETSADEVTGRRTKGTIFPLELDEGISTETSFTQRETFTTAKEAAVTTTQVTKTEDSGYPTTRSNNDATVHEATLEDAETTVDTTTEGSPTAGDRVLEFTAVDEGQTRLTEPNNTTFSNDNVFQDFQKIFIKNPVLSEDEKRPTFSEVLVKNTVEDTTASPSRGLVAHPDDGEKALTEDKLKFLSDHHQRYLTGNSTDIVAAAVFLHYHDKFSSQQCTRLVQARWNYATNLTEANRKKQLEQNLKYSTFKKMAWKNATSFAWTSFDDPHIRRWFKALAVIGDEALPEEKLHELNSVLTQMKSIYHAAKICPYRSFGSSRIEMFKCDVPLDPGVTRIMALSRDYDELLHAWKEWRDVTGRRVKERYRRMVDLSNEAARLNGFRDTGDLWRETYESPNFQSQLEEVWEQLMPLYQQLHAYIRRKLINFYGGGRIRPDGPIPSHLLGNLWGQYWSSLIDITVPFPDNLPVDITPYIEAKNMTRLDMFKTANMFFTSMGLNSMPPEFWKYSIMEKPKDRSIMCRATAWDFCNGKDFRISHCTDVTLDDFITVHHEMAHIHYFMQYSLQPNIFRDGANPGFHEAVADTVALSASSPQHLFKIGLLDELDDSAETSINSLLLDALDKIVFMPFSYIVDMWRWRVFSDEYHPDEWNRRWWELRLKYQGICPPVKRTEADFDPGSKYHILANTPYIRYFVSYVTQFQMHKALCDASGHVGPLHQCDIYGSRMAGEVLRQIMEFGSSYPWPEVMKIMTDGHTDKMDAQPLLEYFKPLIKWLEEENRNETIGWMSSDPTVCP